MLRCVAASGCCSLGFVFYWMWKKRIQFFYLLLSKLPGQKRGLFKAPFSYMITWRYLPGIVSPLQSDVLLRLWLVAFVVGDVMTVSNSQACDEVLNACRTAKWHLGSISVASAGKCSSALCAGSGSCGEAGWFLACAGLRGQFVQRIGQSALEALNIADTEPSKNCGRCPRKVQMPCCCFNHFS